MRLLAPDSEADLYAISCRLGLTKIGVAADAKERRRSLQVGSPLPLELAGSYRYRRAEDAYAVAAELRRQLAERHERGGWYRVSPAEVGAAIATDSARQAARGAAEARRAALVAAAAAKRERAERARQRRRAGAQSRRQKLRALARLLAAGLTQQAAGTELGVSERTIRRWTKLPGFAAELARARHARGLEPETAVPSRAPAASPAAAAPPDKQEARLQSGHDLLAAGALAADGGIEELVEATGLRTRENLVRLVDPALVAQARRNDAARAPLPER